MAAGDSAWSTWPDTGELNGAANFGRGQWSPAAPRCYQPQFEGFGLERMKFELHGIAPSETKLRVDA